MEPFTISTILTKKEYTNILFKEIYKRPFYIILTIAGIGIAIMSALELVGAFNFHEESLFLKLGIGILLVLTPSVAVLIQKRNYYSNPANRQEITYTFCQEEVRVVKITSDSRIKWDHFIKFRQLNGFLLLYTNSKNAFFIKEDKLTQEQLVFIKSKIK
jgi:hypothetical protein